MYMQHFGLLCGFWYYNSIKRNDALLSNVEEEHKRCLHSTMRSFFPIFPDVQEYLLCKTMFFLCANSLILCLNEDKAFRVFISNISNISDVVLTIFTYNIVFHSSVCNPLLLKVAWMSILLIRKEYGWFLDMTKMTFYVKGIVTGISSTSMDPFIALAEYKSFFRCDLGGRGKLRLVVFPGFLNTIELFQQGNVLWVFQELWNLWNTDLRQKQLCCFTVL